jgi:hypothetical protein
MKQPTTETPTQFAVFQHKKRRQWGFGIIAWEQTHKRGYLFEDGQLRVISEQFYSLMREVDQPPHEVQQALATLRPRVKAASVDDRYRATPRPSAKAISFDDQFAIFRAEYPDGFADQAWTDQQRGTGATKLVARHRDPAISKAAARLGGPELRARLAQQQFRPITDDVVAVLRQTDLVPSAEIAELKTGDDGRRQALATAVCELLHGQAAFGTRFDRFVAAFERAFGRFPSWQLATALPALTHPSDHICVRPTSFREQARALAPRLSLTKEPSSSSYAHCLSMAVLISSKLTERAQPPRDLMDVYDFMRLTTRPAGKRLLATLKSKRQAPPAAAEMRPLSG